MSEPCSLPAYEPKGKILHSCNTIQASRSATYCHGRGNSSLQAGGAARRWVVGDGWRRHRNQPVWPHGEGEDQRLPENGCEKADPRGARPNRTNDILPPVQVGRIAKYREEQKEGYSRHALVLYSGMVVDLFIQ